LGRPFHDHLDLVRPGIPGGTLISTKKSRETPDTHPIEVYTIKGIFSEESQQVAYKYGSVASRADHIAENRLGFGAIVIECPTPESDHRLQSTILLFQVRKVREE